MILLILGAIILILVLRDVFETVVVPRETTTAFRIAPLVARNIAWPPYRQAASSIKSPLWRHEVLGMYGPLLIMMLLAIWICILIFGFGLIALSLAKEYSPHLESLNSALYVAGCSVLTLGCSEYAMKTTGIRLLTLVAAFNGMLITASVVSLLFTLMGALQRRELLVSVTSNIAGTPPSGITILETHSLLNGQQSLSSFYDTWHIWCADVMETHRAYPMLLFFRSTDAFTSWLTALGAALDSAALILSSDPDGDIFAVKLMYKSGNTLVNELAARWRLSGPTPPELDEHEFQELYRRLQEAGYCSSPEEVARSAFQELRGDYLASHQALCNYFSVPQTPLLTAHRFSLTIPKTKQGSS